MRIISGSARGTKLETLEGQDTRPTLDRVKEALFSIIQNYIYEANILDLFSGSGALALESLSRGATFAVCCDSSRKAIEIIKQNAKKTHLEDKVKIVNKDYKQCLNELENIKFDIIAYYFAISNGYTDDGATVFNDDKAYLKSVDSLWDKNYNGKEFIS